MRSGMFLSLAAAAALAGCVQPAPSPGVAVPLPIKTDSCGAAGYAGLVSSPLSTFNVSGVRGPVRVLAPGSVMTMDYRGDRLNIEHNERGVITRIYCG